MVAKVRFVRKKWFILSSVCVSLCVSVCTFVRTFVRTFIRTFVRVLVCRVVVELRFEPLFALLSVLQFALRFWSCSFVRAARVRFCVRLCVTIRRGSLCWTTCFHRSFVQFVQSLFLAF